MELFLFVFPFLTLTQSLSAFDWPLPDNPRYQTVMPHNEHRYWPPEVIPNHRYWPPPQQPNPVPPDPLPAHRVINPVPRPSVQNTNRNNHRSSTRDSSDVIGTSDRFRSSQSSSESNNNNNNQFRSQEPRSPVRHVPYDEPYHHPMDHYQPSERSTESSFHATEVPISSMYEPKESSSFSQPNERIKPQQNFRQSANHVRVKERIPATNYQFDPPPPPHPPPSSQETPPKELHHYGHDVFNDPRDPPEDHHTSRDGVTNDREDSSPNNNQPLQGDRESEEEALRREEEFRKREDDRIKEEKRIKEEADRVREETRRRDENRRREEERRRRDEERRKIEELRRREDQRMREEDERRKQEEEKLREEERLKFEQEEKLREEEKKEKEKLLSRDQPSEEGSDYDRSHDGADIRYEEDNGQSGPSPKPPQPTTEAPKVEPVTKSYRPRPVSRPGRGGRYGRRRMSAARTSTTTTTTTTTTQAPLQPAESDQPEYYDDEDDYYDYQPTTTTRRPRRRRPKGGRRRMTPEPTSSTTPSTTTKRTTLSPNYRERADGRIIDFRADPNYPHELKGFDLTEYPFYIQVPDGIKFKCEGRHDGYYANIEHFCQIYHHCAVGNRYDFLCPNYTLFDQTTFTCRFVNMVDCKKSEKSYDRNFELYAESTTAMPATSLLTSSSSQTSSSSSPSISSTSKSSNLSPPNRSGTNQGTDSSPG